MKKSYIFSVLYIVATFPLNAAERINPSLEFLAGSYVLIGRFPDSNQTFSGTVKASINGKELKIVRVINGRTFEALGKMDTATPDKIQVLKVTFKDNGKKYEETCMFSGDLDNYARVTCYLYQESTKKVGLEAWFPDHGQLVQE